MLTIKDFKTAFNSLLKTKGYIVTVVLTLGLMLGALVAMFNLNYQMLLIAFNHVVLFGQVLYLVPHTKPTATYEGFRLIAEISHLS